MFNFDISEKGPATTVVKIIGELRRGLGESEAFLRFQSELLELEKRSATRIILFDLTGMRYWDTLGINLLLGTILKINSRSPRRSGVIGRMTGPSIEAAKDKFANLGSSLLPWEETEAKLLDFLTR